MNKTEVVNKALIFLEEPPLNNLDEDTETARLIESVYFNSLCVLFDNTPFDFGYRTAKLNLTEPQYEDLNYKYSYYMPDNSIYNLAVESRGELKNFRFAIKERYRDFREVNDDKGRIIILSNVPQAWCMYYAKTLDVSVFPIDFAYAFSYLIASEIAPTITGKKEDVNAAIAMFNHYKGTALAKSLNRQKNYNKARRVPNIIRVRNRSYHDITGPIDEEIC